MALKKDIDTVFSDEIVATYWKITAIDIDFLAETSRVIVSGYADQEARLNNKAPLLQLEYQWNGLEYPFSITELNDSNPLVIAYEKLKLSAIDRDGRESNKLVGATDI